MSSERTRAAIDHLRDVRRHGRACLACATVMIWWPQIALAQSALHTPDGCPSQRGELHAVLAVSPSGSLRLDDGRDVQLASVILPPSPLSLPGDAEAWAPLVLARAAVNALTGPKGAEIAINAAAKPDRYGRTSAEVSVVQAGERIWLQRALVAQGHAIVLLRHGGSSACIAMLYEAEVQARQDKRGLWANAAYRIRDANSARDLSRLRSQFALVEGKVVNVTERSGRMFLNFGDDWKTDFTIAVPKAMLSKEPETSTYLSSLSGHRIRVRGWIERRYGPSIEIAHADDIEDLGTSTAAAPP